MGRSSSNSRSSSSSSIIAPTPTRPLRAVVAVAVRGAGQLIGAATPIPPLLRKVKTAVRPGLLEVRAVVHVVHTKIWQEDIITANTTTGMHTNQGSGVIFAELELTTQVNAFMEISTGLLI